MEYQKQPDVAKRWNVWNDWNRLFLQTRPISRYSSVLLPGSVGNPAIEQTWNLARDPCSVKRFERSETIERLERFERSVFCQYFRWLNSGQNIFSNICLKDTLGPFYVGHDEDFTILSFARFRCAIRDFALMAIFSAATSAFLIVCSILSGAIPRRIRLSIIFFLRSDQAAFLICLTSANISFGIFVIPLHYRVFIYRANLMVPSVRSHGPRLDLSDPQVRIDLWKKLKDQRFSD